MSPFIKMLMAMLMLRNGILAQNVLTFTSVSTRTTTKTETELMTVFLPSQGLATLTVLEITTETIQMTYVLTTLPTETSSIFPISNGSVVAKPTLTSTTNTGASSLPGDSASASAPTSSDKPLPGHEGILLSVPAAIGLGIGLAILVGLVGFLIFLTRRRGVRFSRAVLYQPRQTTHTPPMLSPHISIEMSPRQDPRGNRPSSYIETSFELQRQGVPASSSSMRLKALEQFSSTAASDNEFREDRIPTVKSNASAFYAPVARGRPKGVRVQRGDFSSFFGAQELRAAVANVAAVAETTAAAASVVAAAANVVAASNVATTTNVAVDATTAVAATAAVAPTAAVATTAAVNNDFATGAADECVASALAPAGYSPSVYSLEDGRFASPFGAQQDEGGA